jgi:hypothetical protein
VAGGDVTSWIGRARAAWFGDDDQADAIDPAAPAPYGSGVYLEWLADELLAAGLVVDQYPGWMTRARSSGGYVAPAPTCVMWHHTASAAALADDAAYCAEGSPDAPICNLLVGRDGTVVVIAAGATNTNGKGGPLEIPPGVLVPADSMNTHALGMEIANSGVGEVYPAAQIDAAFTASLAITTALGLPPDAVATHHAWAPDRKIDPARADAVHGPWRPRSINASGTWSLDDLRAELVRRAGWTSLPPEEEPPMPRQLVRNGPADDSAWNAYVCWGGGKYWLQDPAALEQAKRDFGYDPIPVDAAWMRAQGPCSAPVPETADPWGVWTG